MQHKTSKVCKYPKTEKQTSPVAPVNNNQNILEAAAKNTIFRDSFIPMGAPTVMDSENKEQEDKVNELKAENEESMAALKSLKEDNSDVVKRRMLMPICFCLKC